MARALIVGCGCRGQGLAQALLGTGWLVRATSRDPARVATLGAEGIEATLADPDRIGQVLDQVGDVAVVYWLLGSAVGAPDEVAALHGARLERLLEEIVDSPVRGFVYEGAGTLAPDHLERGAAAVRAASQRWRIPVEVVEVDPTDARRWQTEMVAAARRLTG